MTVKKCIVSLIMVLFLFPFITNVLDLDTGTIATACSEDKQTLEHVTMEDSDKQGGDEDVSAMPMYLIMGGVLFFTVFVRYLYLKNKEKK